MKCDLCDKDGADLAVGNNEVGILCCDDCSIDAGELIESVGRSLKGLCSIAERRQVIVDALDAWKLIHMTGKRFILHDEAYTPVIADQENNLNIFFLSVDGAGVTDDVIRLAEKVVEFLNSLPPKNQHL